jgi:hypothetical protein
MPIGMAVVGPTAAVIGVAATLWICVGAMWATWAAILSLPSVWRLRSQPAEGGATSMAVP